jgi:ABC-2 type transport system permease protein/capsular polysaccharide transport system permease protein
VPFRSTRFSPLFLATVVIPTVLAILYFAFFASDVFVSESRFVVRSPSKAAATSLGQVLSGSGLSGASEESNAVIEYLESRSALADADRDGLLTRAYTAGSIFLLDRFGGFLPRNRERFFDYYLKKVEIEPDTTTQVLHLQVRAFDPRQSQAINERLLERSETLVNRLSARARNDAVAVAESDARAAQERARVAAVRLAAYRNRAGIIDPQKEAEARLQGIGRLEDQLVAARTQLRQLEAFTPAAPQVPYLRNQIDGLEREIGSRRSGVAGGRNSLSAATARYQVLQLDSDLAGKQLAATLLSLQDAHAEARRKRAYVERIASPSLPDYPIEPRRLGGILAVLVLGLLIWGILSVLLAGIREHRDG